MYTLSFVEHHRVEGSLIDECANEGSFVCGLVINVCPEKIIPNWLLVYYEQLSC